MKRAIKGEPKGAGKTELAAAIAIAELCGPVRFGGWKPDGTPIGIAVVAPDIPIAAASFGQADLLFGAAKTMVEEGPLNDFLEVYETEMLIKDQPGRMYRVAAAQGTNDGKKATFFVADEVHEWVGSKARVHLVISNALTKRRDAWQLDITTAGVKDEGSVAEKAYEYGKKIESGEIVDPSFFFDWTEPSRQYDITDPDEVVAALQEVYPEPVTAMEGIFFRFFDGTEEHELRRYYFNQWVNDLEQWSVAERWDALADPDRVVPDGEAVTLGFDGSYNGDSTVLIGCTIENPHIFVLGWWEHPGGTQEWRVDIAEVEQAFRDACKRYQVAVGEADPFRWQRSIDILRGEGLPVVDFPTNSAPRMVPATNQFSEAALSEIPGLTHDGDPRMARHVKNCVLKIDKTGPRIVKEHKMSKKRIDGAVGAVLAFDGAVRNKDSASVYETRGLLTV